MKLKLLGPPGTGKTTRLMQLLEKELANGTRSDRIAFLTFTRAAREEALSRTGKTEQEFPYLRTIHSICYRQMSITQDQIVKPRLLRGFGNKIGCRLNGNNFEPWIEEFERSFQPETKDDLLMQVNHCGRHRGKLLKDALEDSSLEIDYKYAVWFTKAYRQWKTSQGLLDYTDLLTFYLESGRPLNIDVIFIDEAQDLSLLQWEVVNKLGSKAQRHYIAGDDDQAIFNWAGADSSAFQNLEVSETMVLDQSFRLSKAVHNSAEKISSRIKNRIPKEYRPTYEEGEVKGIGYFDIDDFTEKTFELFRHHYRGRDIADKLKEEGIPYIGWGSPLLESDVRMALQSWYKLFKTGEVEPKGFKKILKYSEDDFFKFNLDDLVKSQSPIKVSDIFINQMKWQDWDRVMTKIPGKATISQFVKQAGFKLTAKPKTELMSIHQSKGKEAHTVIIDTEISRITYETMLRYPDDEHRCWYVGVSRASHRVLTLMYEGHYSYIID